MSRTTRPYSKRHQRHIWVKGERRDPPDVERLSKALLVHAYELAAAQAEAEAQATAAQRPQNEEFSKEARHETRP